MDGWNSFECHRIIFCVIIYIFEIRLQKDNFSMGRQNQVGQVRNLTPFPTFYCDTWRVSEGYLSGIRNFFNCGTQRVPNTQRAGTRQVPIGYHKKKKKSLLQHF
jgi:hypothetical protein